ncbi:MAG: endonuclease/exonuclease/phosphatase family protein, partial [Proteobacteria bacterium]|nr:endonuclease/exonuclease/phosphatase family protein [Pseudomonadota bacterium]
TSRAQATATSSHLEVVTFNVHGRTGDVVARALRDDPHLRDADVIILEEVHRVGASGCSAACELARALGFHAVYAPGHVQDDGTDGVAIVSRLPIHTPEVIELPHYDVHWNDGRRIAMAATIELDDRPVTIYAVHLENRITVAQRRAQMQPVLEHARRRTTPIIVAGDFNTSPFTWIAHAIPVLTNQQDDGLEALMRDHGFATPTADSGSTSRFLGMKLDAIYTRGFATTGFATANADEISDHIALWANVELIN